MVKTILLPTEKPMTSETCALLIATLPLEMRGKIGDFIKGVFTVFQAYTILLNIHQRDISVGRYCHIKGQGLNASSILAMMKKKKQISSIPLSDLDLKSLIHQHSLFFDNLVELIPARFYLPVDEDEKPWFQGLSKVAKASAKKESRENIKKARRARLDPEKAASTLDLLKKNIDEEKKKEEEESDEEGVKFEEEKIDTNKKEDRSVTYEELRERLHRKIEELRSKRNAAGDVETPRREKRRQFRQGKRKSDEEDGDDKADKAKESEKARKVEEDVTKAAEGLAFSHVKLGGEEDGRKKKRKLSKLQTLEQAKKLEEEKKDPEKGEKLLWDSVRSRAAGVKVHDNPKLIKKSIQKEKKKPDKNVEKWKERVDSKDKVRAEKQQKRSGNIAERIHDKKMRKIAKREKKLMRPGFEGRKEGFITKS